MAKRIDGPDNETKEERGHYMPTTKRKEREAQRGLGSVKRMGQPPAGAVAYDEERALYKDGDGILLTPEVVAQRRRERKKAAVRSRKSPSTKLRPETLIFDAVALGHDADHVASPEEDGAEGDGPDACGERQVVPSEGDDAASEIHGTDMSWDGWGRYTREEWDKWHNEHGGFTYYEVHTSPADVLTFFQAELARSAEDATPGILVLVPSIAERDVIIFVPDIALEERAHVSEFAWSDPEFEHDCIRLQDVAWRMKNALGDCGGLVYGKADWDNVLSMKELTYLIYYLEGSPTRRRDMQQNNQQLPEWMFPWQNGGSTPAASECADDFPADATSPVTGDVFPRHPEWSSDPNAPWYSQPATPMAPKAPTCCICLDPETADSDKFKLATCLGWTGESPIDGRCSCTALFHRDCLRTATQRVGREVVDWRNMCAMRFKPRVLPCVPDCCVESVFAACWESAQAASRSCPGGCRQRPADAHRRRECASSTSWRSRHEGGGRWAGHGVTD